MATVSKGKTFVSAEIVTPAKLNNLVDLATVTDIQTADIADGQITTAKILDANVITAKIADANVTAAKLASNAVETAKIADDAVTNDKLSLAANAGEIKKAINADNDPPIFACRAWVNFDGARNEADTGASSNGSNVLIRASGNVSSVLKNGTGDYTITFTTAMPDANYSVSGITVGQQEIGNWQFGQVQIRGSFASGASARTSTGCRFYTSQSSSGIPLDSAEVHIQIYR
jgi:hypothetical protein